MATPCIITVGGKDYTPAEFMDMLVRDSKMDEVIGYFKKGDTGIGSELYKRGQHKKGRTITKTVADGSKIQGTFKLVSADDVLASHNEETFAQTEGYPKNEDGSTINDRDYERDTNAKKEVIRIAQKYDGRAVSQTPIVTKDGVVIDGNNRTMSRKLAAKNGTDAEYIDALKEQAELYGFEPSDVDAVKNPMLIFEPKEDVPYTTQTLKKFNVAEKKEKSPIEKAVEVSKTISDRARRSMAAIYENAERPSDVTSNPKNVKEIINTLQSEGILQPNEIPRYFDVDRLVATKEGVSFMESLLIGGALNEKTIRLLDNENMGNVKNRLLKAIVPLTQNASLGKDALTADIEGAIELANKAKQSGANIMEAATLKDIFAEKQYSPDELLLALLLEEGGVGKFLKNYNDNVGKEVLFEGKLTKEKIIDNALEKKIKQYEKIKPNLRERTAGGKEQISKTDVGTDKGAIEGQPSTKKFYENIAGANPKNQQGRIKVSPIVGGKPKNIKNIILDVTSGIKQRLFFAKPDSRRGAAGTYSPGNSAVKIRFNGDLDVTAHEIGHSIDDLFGVLKDLQTSPNLQAEAELSKFSPFGSKPPKGHPNPKMYELSEGFAEWLRAYIVNPTEAIKEAPEVFAMYESKVHPEYKKSLEQFGIDVRTFAGSSGRDMTLANVEFEPSKAKGIISEIFKKSDSKNQFNIGWWDKVAANFVNPLQAFNKAVEYAKDISGQDVLPANDPVILSRILLGINGKYGEILQHGMIDSKNNVLKDANGKAKTLKWLLEPLDNTDMSTIKNDMKDVVSYMVAERTLELAGKFNREDVLTGIGGGIFKDVDVAQKTLFEFTNGDPKKLARIKEAASRYRELSDDVLKYMRDKGRLSSEQYDNIKTNNLQYVALNRVLETEPGREIEPVIKSSASLGSKGEPIKTIKGSSKEITNPYISLIDGIYKGVKEADRNEVLSSFRDIIYSTRKMYENEPKRFADIAVIGKQGDKNAITIFKDGKAEHWIFQEDIYNALKGLDKEAYKLPEVVTAFPKMLRWTVTNFPIFAARNIVRDFQDRIVKTEDKSGFADLFGDKEHWRELARSGGLNSGYYMKNKETYYGMMEEAMDDIAKNKKFILLDPIRLKEGWHGYQNLLQKSETVNRVAEYRAAFKRAKEMGMDDYNASIYGAYKARDLMDFAVMGHYMKVINQLIPFSNAAVRGLAKTASSAKQNPSAFAIKMLAYTVAPQIALWLINHRDEETAKEYEALPAHQRDMAWNVKIGDNHWLVIPKPYELGIPASAIDRMLSKSFYDQKDAFNGFAGSVAKATLPVDEGNIAGPGQGIIEGVTNYDFFRNRNIIPPHENSLDLSLRNTKNASRLGKALQEFSIQADKVLPFDAKIDARKLDHFIKSQTSYFGKTALQVSDIGKEDSRNDFSTADLGFFKQTPAYNSKPVQDFMQYAEKWGLTNSKTYKGMQVLAKQYFNAQTNKEKDMAAKVLRDYADLSLRTWEKQNLSELKQKRQEKKQKSPERSGESNQFF